MSHLQHAQPSVLSRMWGAVYNLLCWVTSLCVGSVVNLVFALLSLVILPLWAVGYVAYLLFTGGRVQWAAAVVLIVAPLSITGIATWFALSGFFSPTQWVVTAIIAVISWGVVEGAVGVAHHRYFSHNAFQLTHVKTMTRVFANWAAMALQMDPNTWTPEHRLHHKFGDQWGFDRYSPYNNPLVQFEPDKGTRWEQFLGFTWSHVGWMLDARAREVSPEAEVWLTTNPVWKNRANDPILQHHHDNHWKVVLMQQVGIPPLLWLVSACVVLPFGVSLFTVEWFAVFMLGCHAGRAHQHGMTHFINSWNHLWGAQPHNKDGVGTSARDVWWLNLLTGGEAWHNEHHTFEGLAIHGDPHKFVDRVLDRNGTLILFAANIGWVKNPRYRIQGTNQIVPYIPGVKPA